MAGKRKSVKLTRKDIRFLGGSYKRKDGSTATVTGYVEKLRQLRQYVSGFDGDNWEKVYLRTSTDPDVAYERRRQIARVTNKFAVLKPFLVGAKKRIAPKSPERVEALRQYAQLPNIKGLRAIPIEASDPAKLRVKFSHVKITLPPARGHKKQRVKDAIRVKIREGHFAQEYYPFPRTVASLLREGGAAELADNLLGMLRDMMRDLPKGWYLFKHRQYALLDPKGTNETFPKQARFFIEAYQQSSPYVLTYLTGVIRLASDAEEYNRLVGEMRGARSRAQYERSKAKLAARERAVRKYIRRGKRK